MREVECPLALPCPLTQESFIFPFLDVTGLWGYFKYLWKEEESKALIFSCFFYVENF